MRLLHLDHTTSRGPVPHPPVFERGEDAPPSFDRTGDESPFERAGDAPPRTPRRQLVAQVTGFLRDNLADPLTVGELSRMAGVSERTLRAAFHDVIGLSPKQFAIAERLRAARRALCQANPGTTTVTDVAMSYGFFELGRFAGRYRRAFGELPSRTLRHPDEPQPEQAA